jgi:hypothetical protein
MPETRVAAEFAMPSKDGACGLPPTRSEPVGPRITGPLWARTRLSEKSRRRFLPRLQHHPRPRAGNRGQSRLRTLRNLRFFSASHRSFIAMREELPKGPLAILINRDDIIARKAIRSCKPFCSALVDQQEPVVCRSDPQSTVPVAEQAFWIKLSCEARNRVGLRPAVDHPLNVAVHRD